MPGKRTRGFTLLEVMIVAVVVGVLAAIALPSYNSYVKRANRAQAKQFLQDIANREEQYRLDQRAYTTALTGVGSLNITTPSDVAVNYSFGATTSGNDCSGTAVVDPAYVLTATAINSQASDGNLCLDSAGNKTPSAKWAN